MIGLGIFMFGLVIGSFLNVVIFSLQTNKSIVNRRSLCPRCGAVITWYDNIPIISFIVLLARCRRCGQKISWQYPLVELTCGLIFFWLYRSFGLSLDFFTLAVFSSFLLIIFVYDLRYSLILDVITLPAIAVALALNLYRGGFGWLELLLGVAVGAGFFLAQYVISKGQWIGGGDIRLGALMGAMLGWPLLLVAGFLAYIAGALVGVVLLGLGKKKVSSPIPFGTFLSGATLVTFVYGQALLDWYLALITY